ncbi:hypothetical protein [Saccharopolyspora taberi]|uniref:Uncharacterized protein n=1 Tax=Saccharopolyspora taberi TaxID=60895 RepID=A0ABN3VMH2_9PSEU
MIGPSAKQQAWQQHMEKSLHALRLKWSEHGLEYIRTSKNLDAEDLGPAPPGGSPKKNPPQVGYPAHHPLEMPTDRLMAEWNKVDQKLVDLFTDKFLSGDLGHTDDVIEDLSKATIGDPLPETMMQENGNARISLGDSSADHFKKLDARLEQWRGQAYLAFYDHRVDLEKALAMCQDRVAALWRSFVHYKKAVHGFKKDILELIKTTNDQVEKGEAGNPRLKMNAASMVMNTTAAFVGVAATVGTGGGATAAWVAVGAAVGSGALGDQILRVGGEPDLPGKAIADMTEAGDRIVEEAEKNAHRVKKAFHAVTASVTGDNLVKVRPPRSNIVRGDSFDPDEFHHEDHGPAERQRVDRGKLVDEPKPQGDRRSDHEIKDPDNHGKPKDDGDAYKEQ